MAKLTRPDGVEISWTARGEGPLILAPPYSIARRLIDAWLAAG